MAYNIVNPYKKKVIQFSVATIVFVVIGAIFFLISVIIISGIALNIRHISFSGSVIYHGFQIVGAIFLFIACVLLFFLMYNFVQYYKLEHNNKKINLNVNSYANHEDHEQDDIATMRKEIRELKYAKEKNELKKEIIS